MQLLHLSKGEVKTLITLMGLMKQGINNPSRKTLAQLTGVSFDHTKRCIRTLETKGCITVLRSKPENGRDNNNVYFINEDLRKLYFN